MPRAAGGWGVFGFCRCPSSPRRPCLPIVALRRFVASLGSPLEASLATVCAGLVGLGGLRFAPPPCVSVPGSARCWSLGGVSWAVGRWAFPLVLQCVALPLAGHVGRPSAVMPTCMLCTLIPCTISHTCHVHTVRSVLANIGMCAPLVRNGVRTRMRASDYCGCVLYRGARFAAIVCAPR